MQAQSLSLRKWQQGALPLVDHYLRRLGWKELLAPQIGHPSYCDALDFLVKSVLLEPKALYRIETWAQAYDPAWRPSTSLTDDVLGRALDRLFEVDRASLLTALVVRAINSFGIQTDQIHNDSTSVKFAGAYAHQKPQALQLRRGHSKDHRPDLKQLVYCLSVSADGAVPVHFKAYPGNQADDPTHRETWECLCRILGRSDFLYVADSKLCARQNLLFIVDRKGRVITILPRTRSEVAEFAQQAADNLIQWKPLWTRRALRQRRRQEHFELAVGPRQTSEGFHLHWYRSSEKQTRDVQDRQDRVSAVLRRLQQLNERRGRGPKTEPAMRRAAENLLAKYHVQSLVQYQIEVLPKAQHTQLTLRQPVRQVIRKRVIKPTPVLSAHQNLAAIARAATIDGTFPLVTNTDLSPLEVLQKYKYQPHLEKRHFLNKTVLEISPVFLKNNLRVEALMVLYFVAQLVAALCERVVRRNMLQRGIKTLPILPEQRESKTPSFTQIRETFAHRTKADLYDHDLKIKSFVDPLTNLQQMLLQLLEVDATIYS